MTKSIFPVLLSYTYIHTFYPQDLKIITPPLTNSGLRLVAKRDDDGEELIKQFNQGLETLKQQGKYAKTLERWGFSDVSIKSE